MKLFDAHCHLQMPQFDADRGNVLARMRDSNIGALVVGTDYEMSKAGLEVAKQSDFLWASVGLHPNDNASEEFDFDKYEILARDPKVVAIGECGLDYFRNNGEGQKERFSKHIELAEKVGKSLIIHCRNAHEDMIEILKEKKPTVAVVMHFFTGTGELAQTYLGLGCYLSFPGPITYTDTYDESIRVAPLDKILCETDSPFAAPVPHRGERNEPVYVEEVAKKIAAVKGLSLTDVSASIVQNTQAAFGLQF